MSEELVIQRGITIPAWELWWTASRSGGPGDNTPTRQVAA